MLKQINFLAAALMSAVGVSAADSAQAPLWMRHAAISPDSKEIAFSYKGDIFVVPANGGAARQLTSNGSYDAYPIWSPDGKTIAFGSDREGSLDIFVIPAAGGTAKRVTNHSVNETPVGWLNDSTILFSAAIQPRQEALQGQFLPQTYKVAVTGGRPTLFKSTAMPSLDVNHAGQIVYHDKKGFEDKFRKHERSSGTSDIWLLEGDKYKKLTDFNGHDLSPRWSGDNSIVYISEEDGTLNVWSRNLDGSEKRQLTHMKKHPVRDLTRGNDGTLAFSWNGEIYTMREGSQPVKVDIDIAMDDYAADAKKSILRSGATTMAVSPDGEQVAFVVRGDVYVTSAKYKTTRRITNTAAQERCVTFAPDGKSVIYDSDRDGQWKLFRAKIVDKDGDSMAYADEIEEELLYASDKAAQQPEVSPDGKKVAFLEDRTTVKVIDLATKSVVTALDGKFNYSYSDGDIEMVWSPDSRWLLTTYIGEGGWNKDDIALVKADGSEVINLTESGYSNSNPRWAMGGKAVTYETGKYGLRSHGSWGEQSDVIVMFLDGEAWDEFRQTEEEAEIAKEKEKKSDDAADEKNDKDKKNKEGKKGKKGEKDNDDDSDVKPLEFDLANRQYRLSRLSPMSGYIHDYFLNPEGTKFYYINMSAEGDYDLYEHDLREGDVKVFASDLAGGIVPDKKGENLFVITSNGMKKINLSSGSVDAIEFEAEYYNRPAAEREYIYDHMLSQVNDKFYDVNLHGVDWKMYGEAYRRFLPHINNNYDFADLMSEVLGELNASHTGARYYGGGASMSTANLGAFFDQEYAGDGLKISEVIPRGPLSVKSVSAKPGDIIEKIDGVAITPLTDLNLLLEGKAGRKIRVDLKRASGATDRVTVKPISQGMLSELLYQRWIERNAAIVDSLSDGRLGYVHVRGMDSPSFREVYSKLLGKYRNREAVIVDTRYNGGGWLHNDIALLLNGKEYVKFSPRGQYVGTDPISQWTKPSVMLVNEANYSDAYGTPYVYQTLGIGDIVGAPIPGTMTAVWWETQIDPSLVFGIPEVTCLNREGLPLENKQLTPEVVIYTNPGEIESGYDAQIAGAVDHLLKQLDAAK